MDNGAFVMASDLHDCGSSQERRLNALRADLLAAAQGLARDNGNTLVIDLRHVKRAGARFLGILGELQGYGVAVALANVHPNVRLVLEAVHFSNLIVEE